MRVAPSSGSGLIALAEMLAGGYLELTESFPVTQAPGSVVCCWPRMIGD